MPVHRWEEWGTASGLQATEARAQMVYVSCGGDPFFEGEQKTYLTDGFPALARMVIIAGQETGHFSDLIHGKNGGIYGRYSTDNARDALRASPEVLRARRSDVQHVAMLERDLRARGLERLRRAERAVKFYRRQKRFVLWSLCQLWRGAALLLFTAKGGWRVPAAYVPAPAARRIPRFLDRRHGVQPRAGCRRLSPSRSRGGRGHRLHRGAGEGAPAGQ